MGAWPLSSLKFLSMCRLLSKLDDSDLHRGRSLLRLRASALVLQDARSKQEDGLLCLDRQRSVEHTASNWLLSRPKLVIRFKV